MGRLFSFVGRHKLAVIAVAGALIAVSATSAWAITYDHGASDRLLPGMVIEGVDVGGLDRAQAVSLLKERVEAPLHRSIHVTVENHSVETTPWDLGLRVDVDAAVTKAMARGQEGNIVSRVWRRLFGNDNRPIAATPKWGEGAMTQLIDGAASAVALEPENAALDVSTGWVSVVPEKTGLVLDKERSQRALLEAVKLGEGSVRLVTTTVYPEVRSAQFAKVILVRTGENKLYLYENGRIARSWSVATGEAKYPTPTGIWRVNHKLANPTWINPGSSWAASMPARIGPGPNNPLGTHALALNAPGILIHGTSDKGSIGYNASHGCIRMIQSDELELAGQVAEGTPVAIVNAGPPKSRSAAAPVATPEEEAVINF